MSRHLIEDDPRHLRAAGVSVLLLLPLHGFFFLTPRVLPSPLDEQPPIFFWPLQVLYWVSFFGIIPLFLISFTLLCGVYYEATNRFLFSVRVWLYRWVFFVCLLGLLWFLIVGGLWLSLLAFWGRWG